MARIKGKNSRLTSTPVKAAALLAISVLAAAAFCILWDKDPYVAKVNGEQLTEREFRYRYNRSGDGEAVETARENALKESIRIKVQQILFLDKDIQNDISYSSFLDDLERENKRRKNAIERKQVIYGPVQFNERDYFEYVFSNNVTAVKEKMKGRELHFSDDELVKFYETIKSEYFKNQDTIRILRISIPYVDEKGNVTEAARKDAKGKIEQVERRLENGEKFEELAAEYNTGVSMGNPVEQVFDSSSVRFDMQVNARILQEARRLQAGQVSGIIEENSYFYMIKCIDRRSMGYKQLEEVKGQVETLLLDKKYEELIDKLVEKAEIEINSKIYSRIML